MISDFDRIKQVYAVGKREFVFATHATQVRRSGESNLRGFGSSEERRTRTPPIVTSP